MNATTDGWRDHYQMYSYISEELPSLVEQNIPVIAGVKSVSGHSMGGHGALIMALKNQQSWRSVSAFAPICHPMICGWGQGCFEAYLGDNQQDWRLWDACCLIEDGNRPQSSILVHQGAEDNFLDDQLHPLQLSQVCQQQAIDLQLHMAAGYDHSYNFVSSFIGEHIAFHAQHLK